MKKTLPAMALSGLLASPINTQASPALEFSGLIEVEAVSADHDSDLPLATAELGMRGSITPVIASEITFLYEGDTTDVDTAVVHIALPDSYSFYTLGQMYLPFGSFESHLVSDPLTLVLAEIRETTIQLGYQWGAWSSSVFIFNGSNKQDLGAANEIDNVGFHLGWSKGGTALALAYINDLGDSDTLQDAINAALGSNDISQHVPGVAFNARIEISAFTLLAEYVTATQTFAAGELDSVEVQPAASHIEMAYALELGGRASTFAIASQSTDEASALDVPRRRTIASVSVEILEQASLALEVARDAAYDGSNSNSITAQFAVAF